MSNIKGNGGSSNPGSYLVVPYYTGDLGSRPLPSSYPFWACSAIKVDGSPYAGQKLHPGQSVALSLDVINYGTLTAPTVCLFFWADPTTNFTNATVQLIGTTSLALPRAVLTTTSVVTWVVPDGTPEHICLLAEASTPADPTSAAYNAAADRHYGQQNIQVISASPGGQFRIGFVMTNGKANASRFRLEVTPVLANHRALRHLVPENAVLREAEEIHLKRVRSATAEKLDLIHVNLAVDDALEVELSGRVPRDAKPGSTIVLQLAQYADQHHRPMGGLGVVVHVK
jgi:hypothetical protein